MRDLSSGSHPRTGRPDQDPGVRLPLLIATVVLLVVGVLAGVVVLGSAADADPPPVEPITVQAPAAPPPVPGQQAPAPAPRDEAGYVAPPPPVDDDDDDDGPDDDLDDGPDDDD
jgi:hypothetical protein